MPAKENPSSAAVLLHLSPDTEATTKLIRKDVDKLVQNIKDNLKLSYEAVQQHDKSSSFADYHLPPTGISAALLDQQRHTPPPTALCAPGGSSRKARSYMSSKGASRASPYAVPGGKCDCDESGRRPGSSSWAARKRYPSMSAAGKPKIELDDPLEMLQELIRLALDFPVLFCSRCRPLLVSGCLILC
jgi:hypothetical protein